MSMRRSSGAVAFALGLAVACLGREASANGHDQALRHYRAGERALARQEFDVATRELAQAIDANPWYGYAAAAACKLAVTLQAGAKASARNFVPFDADAAARLVGFGLALAREVDYAFVERSTAPDAELKRVAAGLRKRKLLPQSLVRMPERDELPRLARSIVEQHAPGEATPAPLRDSAVRKAVARPPADPWAVLLEQPYELQRELERRLLANQSLSRDEQLHLVELMCRYGAARERVAKVVERLLPELGKELEPPLVRMASQPGTDAEARGCRNQARRLLALVRHPGTLAQLADELDARVPEEGLDRDLQGALMLYPVESWLPRVLAMLDRLLVQPERAERAVRDVAEMLAEAGTPGRLALTSRLCPRVHPVASTLVLLQALERAGDPVEPSSLACLGRDATDEIRAAFYLWLGKRHSPQATALARGCLASETKDGFKPAILRAVDASALSRPDELLPIFAHALAQDLGPHTSDYHGAALRGLMQISSPEALAVAIRYRAKDRNTAMAQLRCVLALARLDHAAAAGFARLLINDADEELSRLANAILKALHEPQPDEDKPKLLAGPIRFEPHVVQNMKISVGVADFVAVGRLVRVLPGPHGTRGEYQIDKVLMGKLPPTLLVLHNGLPERETRAGDRYLLYLQEIPAARRAHYDAAFGCTGHFEHIKNGAVLGYPEAAFLDELSFHIDRALKARGNKPGTPRVFVE